MRQSGLSAFVALALSLCAACSELPPAPDAARVDALRKLLEQGRFAAVTEESRSLLEQLEASEGEESPSASRVRDILVESLWRGGKARQEQTLALAERAVRIKERSTGSRHVALARSLDNLGNVLLRSGEYGAARPHFERSVEIREATLGPDHAEIADSLNSLGWVFYATGDLDLARDTYDRGLRIREAAFGPTHPKVATSLNNIAVLLRARGDYAAATAAYERALRIYEAADEPQYVDLSTALNNLAVLLKSRGDYAAARSMYERALEVVRGAVATDHPLVAAALNNLAALDREIGDYSSAGAMHEQALEIFEKAGADSLEVASTLNNLAILHADQGDNEKAGVLFERVLAIQERKVGADSRQVGKTLTNLGQLLARTGDLPAAQRRLERALEIREHSLGPEHPRTASTRATLADVLRQRGDTARAHEQLERTVAVYEKQLGPDHPDLARALNDLAALLLETGRSRSALELALRADEIGREHLRLTARTLPERQALRYASVRPAGLDLALSNPLLAEDPDAREEVWDALIRSRALVLDEMRLRHVHASQAAGPAAELTQASERVANLLVRGPRGSQFEQYRRLLLQARREKERAERTLAEASLAFRRQEEAARIGFAEVAEALPPGHALVSYVRYVRHGDESVPSYLAFVLRSRPGRPVVVPLGPADRIESLAKRWRKEIAAARGILPAAAGSAERRYRETGEKLRELIWDPVARYLDPTDRPLVVPDGTLHLVSLATLPTGEGGYLIETTLSHYLTTERDLVRPGPTEGRDAKGLFVLGGPDFGTDLQPVDSEGCTDFHSLQFQPLHGSAAEARAVSALWSARAPVEERSRVRTLVGVDASEETFKRDAPGHRILHLATHGFFVAEQCASTALPAPGLAPPPDDNPLLSGLALAGANLRRRTDTDREEDGVLMAEEVAAMDLSGVEWVVLSACETGLGEVQNGEGVLGLRRAFEVAGARTLVMSLWSVDDASARNWMRRLYEGRLDGLSSAEAVRRAGVETLHARRDNGQSTHPYYWGAFTAVGEWR